MLDVLVLLDLICLFRGRETIILYAAEDLVLVPPPALAREQIAEPSMADDDVMPPPSVTLYPSVCFGSSIGNNINYAIKRFIDVAVGSILIISLSPLFLLVALLICLDGGPLLSRDVRLGRHLRSFSCWKFRSMMPGAEQVLEEYLSYNAEDAQLWARERKLAFDPRITTVGRVLRKTSLDELPQLFNVLRGDMSLVGPRPVTRDELAYYGASIGCYASVKPGMTGLWQVSGRSEIGYEARVVLDRCYANVHNVVMDLAILLRTPGAVLSRRGAR